jgi:hypothetical protein
VHPPEPKAVARTQSAARPDLSAKLTVQDLARVRQALAMLSDDPAAESGPSAGITGGSVPSVIGAGPPALSAGDGDDADTFPLPVILPGGPTIPRPEPVDVARGPFEPVRPTAPVAGPPGATPGDPAPVSNAAEESGTPGKGREMPPGAEEKLDQIKDLLLMAEAIGEQNLDRHFDQVSQRQRELIREFFDRAAPGGDQDP